MSREPRPAVDVLRDVNVLLYAGETRERVGFVPLERLLRRALDGRLPKGKVVAFCVTLRGKPDPVPIRGPGPVRLMNVRSDEGSLYVWAFVDKIRVHATEYTLRELLGPVLNKVVASLKRSDKLWWFELTRPQHNEILVLRSEPFPPETSDDALPVRPATALTVRPATSDEPPATAVPDDPSQYRLLPTVILRIRINQPGAIGIGSDVIRPAPPVENAIEVDLNRPRSVPFTIRRAEEPDLPLFDAAAFGIDADQLGRISVVLRPNCHRLLTHDLKLSDRMEEGGFLAGRVFQVGRAQPRFVVEIRRVLPAEHKHTGASSVHFTFTSDSFQAMSRELGGGDERLVGWYHTHLFSAAGMLALSSVDVELHHSTFGQPWQVAGLINVTRNERRLRFYAATETNMEECPLWVLHERDGHRATRVDLGRG